MRGTGFPCRATPTHIASLPSPIRLEVSDLLRLTAAPTLGRNAVLGPDGEVVEPAQIACAVPAAVHALSPGDPVFFDDGKLGGVVERAGQGVADIRITHAKPGGAKLGADKGINLPQTDLGLPPLGPDDYVALDLAVGLADLVGLSFARSPADVRELHRALAQRGADQLGVVLKIETRKGFESLPLMLLEALKRPPVGVMIARGDLAVECGFERLAELQEEILWVSEAAQVPCIWATQVLESLTKRGAASRAEITDAAMAERAECVMLNKGPHIVEAVRTLTDIVGRMRDHQHKKTSRLRPLRSVKLEASTEHVHP